MMPRTCTVCAHEQRDAVDVALIQGTPLRDIARLHGLDHSSLFRHRKAGHLPLALVALHTDQEAQRGTGLAERLEGIVARTEAILDGAEADGRYALALSAIRELRSSLELLGKVTGELRDTPTVAINVLASADWLQVQAAIFRALDAHPEARQAVAGELAQLPK